jgi:hypothetical protein
LDIQIMAGDHLRVFMKEKHVFYHHQAPLRDHQYRLLYRFHRHASRALTPCDTVEKNPFKILAAMNDWKDVAPAHHAAVASARTINQNSTGNLPKKAESATTMTPPAPNMNTFPT